MLSPLEVPFSGPSSTATGGGRAVLFSERAARVLAKLVVAVAMLLLLRAVGLSLLPLWQLTELAVPDMWPSRAPEFVLGYGESLFFPPTPLNQG